jgi:hypothetical protein
MDKRPPAPVRYLVLVGVLVCLVCAVCARGQQPAAEPQPPESEPEPVLTHPEKEPIEVRSVDGADGAVDAGAAPQPETNPPANQKNPPPEPPPKYFPATKAPGFLFR